MIKIVLIGAGNLATNLALEIAKTPSLKIEQVFSRTLDSAKLLGEQISSPYTNNIAEIKGDADLYIFSIKDSALESVLNEMSPQTRNSVWVHTSGSLECSIFKNQLVNYGVLYPLQTFTKGRFVELKNVPLFVESSTKEASDVISEVASSLSTKVYELSSEKRQYLHLTAVMVCNFTNHLYHLAKNILDEEDLSFEYLVPLIEETCNKAKDISPEKAQTGPAVRYDINIINKHLDLLKDESVQTLYKLLSQSIHEKNKLKQ